MSNSDDKNAQEEQLKELEEQAYFELTQIIAEAIQLQDIKILNSRLSSWKIKYKKLLDGSTPNSALIAKIKRLQSDEYIGYIINMIMQRIKITEYVKIENQAKALRKLYLIIKETNDFKTLKSKVEEWEKTYPIQSFMKMYQRKVAYYTRTKTIEDNSFDQEKAFYDLIQITKITGSPKEIKYAFGRWEDTYHIHDKFELDDFIKHQSDVKQYVEEIETRANPDETNSENMSQRTSQQFSDIATQTIAVDALLSIIASPNNLNNVFDWVHKNSSIKFNDEFKALILSKTALEYSPKYLNRLKVPNIDILSSSLTLDEYREINNIKRYAIISYFNLLLPKGQSIPNNYFSNYVEDIYYKTKNVKIVDKVIVPETVVDATIHPTDETQLSTVDSTPINPQDKKENIAIELEVTPDATQEITTPELEVTTYISNIKESDTAADAVSERTENTEQQDFITLDELDISFEQLLDEYPDSFEIDLSKPTEDWHTISSSEKTSYTVYDNTPDIENSSMDKDVIKEDSSISADKIDIPESITYSETVVEEKSTNSEQISQNSEANVQNEEIKNEEVDIIGCSPLFFDTIYNLSVQANIIQKIDNSVEQSIEKTPNIKTIDLEKNTNI